MKSSQDLKTLLERIDRKGYPAYKDIKGIYQFKDFAVSIDYVQGDPYASPSKVSIHVDGRVSGFSKRLFENKERRTALQDTLLRKFGKEADKTAFRAKGSGKSGLIAVSTCGQEILERSSCRIQAETGDILLQIEVGLPANGRSINSHEAIKIFFDFIPECVRYSLYAGAFPTEVLENGAELADDQAYIRKMLPAMGLCAFVTNGAVLPRESGISQKPMKDGIPFVSPASLEVEMNLLYRGRIKGMGIPKGITLIVGGGYHGKSTLLEALERGVYNHIKGDGREYVITDSSAMKIRAEDGRSIKAVDISMFIHSLPNGKDTKKFYTENASGSTSQAANVVEAIEAESKVLLIDEDTSATNFMIRDALMQQVVSSEFEPIVPYIDRIRQLYEVYGISSIIVAGSSGSYFHKADHIIQMKQYVPADITDFAKEKAAMYQMTSENVSEWECPDFNRSPSEHGKSGERRTKIKAYDRDSIQLNRETIDVRYVEQLVDREQLTALGMMVDYAQVYLMDGKENLTQIVDKLFDIFSQKGLGTVGKAMPRKQEIFAVLNRYRGLKL